MADSSSRVVAIVNGEYVWLPIPKCFYSYYYYYYYYYYGFQDYHYKNWDRKSRDWINPHS